MAIDMLTKTMTMKGAAYSGGCHYLERCSLLQVCLVVVVFASWLGFACCMHGGVTLCTEMLNFHKNCLSIVKWGIKTIVSV